MVSTSQSLAAIGFLTPLRAGRSSRRGRMLGFLSPEINRVVLLAVYRFAADTEVREHLVQAVRIGVAPNINFDFQMLHERSAYIERPGKRSFRYGARVVELGSRWPRNG